MLPKPSRLNLKKDFKWVASGKKVDTKFLTLFIRNGDNQNPKVGIAISSKFFKKAHERNRARRLVAEAFRSTYYLLPSTINIAVLPKRHILEVKLQDLSLDLGKKLRDEKIID